MANTKLYLIIKIRDPEYYFSCFAGVGANFCKDIREAKKYGSVNHAEEDLQILNSRFGNEYGIILKEFEIDTLYDKLKNPKLPFSLN